MPTTHCTRCDEQMAVVGRIRIGQHLTCEHCGAKLEIVSTSPLEVDWPTEDLDDDEWEIDEDVELDDAADEDDEEDEDDDVEVVDDLIFELDSFDLDDDELDLDDDFEDDFEDDEEDEGDARWS
jgi:hypothetical protein